MSKIATAQALAKLRKQCEDYFKNPKPPRPTAATFKCPVTRGYAQQIIDAEEARANALRRGK